MPAELPPQPRSLDFVGTPFATRESRFRSPPGVGSYIDPELRGDMAGSAAFEAGRPPGNLPLPKPYDWDGTGDVPNELYAMAADLASVFGDSMGALPGQDNPNRVAQWLDGVYSALVAKGEGCGLDPVVVEQAIINNAQLGPHAVAYAIQEAARTSDLCNKYLIKNPMGPPAVSRDLTGNGPLTVDTPKKGGDKPSTLKWALGGVGLLAVIGTAIYFMTRGAKKRKNPCKCNPLVVEEERENPYGGTAGYTSVDGGALAYAVSPLLNPGKKRRAKRR
jgi:hypothetical protein